MNCPEQEILEQYISGILAESERQKFEEHIERCPQCRDRLAETQENENLLQELRVSMNLESGEPGPGHARIGTVDRAQSILGDRYRVVRKVGEGSAGEVFHALDTALDRSVAVKFLRKPKAREAKDRPKWYEARLMSKLNHPHIAQIYEIGESEAHEFIVMEWVEGRPLSEAWEGLELNQKLQVFLKVLDAVTAAHRKRVIHRDIKPTNILVTTGLVPKILDFGIAVELGQLSTEDGRMYKGTPAFSAPEQLSAPVLISTATDVFALGVILYQLLTDTLPFKQIDHEKLFQAIKTDYPKLPGEVVEDLPVALQNICLKALEKDPEIRYFDAKALGDDIRRYLRGERVWTRPSFLVDKVQQALYDHRQHLKAWQKSELITQREFDKLESIYDHIVRPPDPSIIEARKLSLSQVCLYLGGWIVVLGCFVLFYETWPAISPYLQTAPAIVVTGLMVLAGARLWGAKESRLAVGFLSTATLLIPVTTLLTLALWNILSPVHYPLGEEFMYEENGAIDGAQVIVGNLQLLVCSACWLLFSCLSIKLTKSSIFVFFILLSILAFISTCYIIAGMMVDWEADERAFMYLWPGIAYFIAGTKLDRKNLSVYAWPLCCAGLFMIVLCLSVLASEQRMLITEWSALSDTERVMLGFVVNGALYLGLASLCRKLGTPLQRTMATLLNWLGSFHILWSLRSLDSDEVDSVHALIYRIILPIASLLFVFGSVIRQMKSFFFAGLSGIAASIHKLTIEHLSKYFAWPFSLIVCGTLWMLVSWFIPRRKSQLTPKHQK